MNSAGFSATNVTLLDDSNWSTWRSQVNKILGALECKGTISARYSNVKGDELTEDELRLEAELTKKLESADGADRDKLKRECDEKRKELGILLIERKSDDERQQD